MGFDQLPEFPQGGIARAESGNQGIPPESFQQALLDQGINLIAKRPEDSPAVQAALTSEVDTVLDQMGIAPSPASQQQAQAPARPDTPPPFAAPAPQQRADTARPGTDIPIGPITPEAIQRVMQKFKDPTELAKAYAHSQSKMTRTQQERAVELNALRSTVESLQQEISALRNAAENIGVTRAAGQTAASFESASEDPEAFFKDPVGVLGPVIEKTVSQVVRDHLMAYTDAQTRYQQETSFEEYRASKAQEIERLRPFLDQVYMEDQAIFERLDPRSSLDLLLKRGQERQDALRGQLFFEEMRNLTGAAPQGTPANAAPGQTGALPQAGAGVSRMQQSQVPAGGNWSNTQNMNRLWKTRSDSVDEMAALTEVLKERGFGNDVPI